MDAFEQLSEEHGQIRSMLDSFEKFVTEVERQEISARGELARFVGFFREFVDLRHHDKEEAILLPALARHGFHWSDGVLYQIRQEHDQERYLVRSLRHVALQADSWSDADRRHFSAIARELIGFLRMHMAHEEQLLFPEARRRLPAEVILEIAADFARLDERAKKQAALAAASP